VFRNLAEGSSEWLGVVREIGRGRGMYLAVMCLDEHARCQDEFHSRADSHLDETNIFIYIVSTSDTIVAGDGYRATCDCTL
jgi:hypothetical protein